MSAYKRSFAELAGIMPDAFDVFICCASYEERSLSVAKSIDKSRVEKVLLVYNENMLEYVESNKKLLSDQFPKRVNEIAIDSSDPIKTADSLYEWISRIRAEGAKKFLIDITTFTHESLLILLKLFTLNLDSDASVNFIYTGAKDYSTGDEPGAKWLSKGIVDIRSVLGFAGEILSSRKTHLISLVGIEYERASKLIEIYEPNMVSLGCGKSGEADKDDVVRIHFDKLRKEVTLRYPEVKTFEFYCYDPWEAKKAILKQVEESPEHNIVLSPMNTKISTIGAALASFENERIQICYAQALTYNYRKYSSPDDVCYLFEIPELLKK